MQKYEGEVVNIRDNDWNGTKLWSFQLKGQNIWFRTGQTELPHEAGTLVSFMANPSNKQVDKDSVKVITELASGDQTGSSPAPARPATNSREDYWQARERHDATRSARADAARIVCAALEADHLPHASNVAKGKRLDLLMGYVKEITEELLTYEDNSSRGS